MEQLHFIAPQNCHVTFVPVYIEGDQGAGSSPAFPSPCFLPQKLWDHRHAPENKDGEVLYGRTSHEI